MNGETEKHVAFRFGENWRSFLSVLDDERIAEAEKSVRGFMGVNDLNGKTFLDIGSGSGLFSLVARRLGAEVCSFDYDATAAECARELKRRYFDGDAHWRIMQGSVLDGAFVDSLGRHDIAYSWGVLHHTGDLWRALRHAQMAVKDGGLLYIAVYNDQGVVSKMWKAIKKAYCSGRIARALITPVFYMLFLGAVILYELIHLRNPLKRWARHKKHRGMSFMHDWKDWLGGYPYEPAAPGKVISFMEESGFVLRKFERTEYGFGNNQYLFQKVGMEQSGGKEPT